MSHRAIRAIRASSASSRACADGAGPAHSLLGRRAWSRVHGLRALAHAALMVSVLAGAGCQSTVTESSNARPMPQRPVAPPPVPSDAQVSALTVVLLTPKARDTTGNGRADLILIEAYLFAQPFPSPVFAPGEFVFELYPLGTVGTAGATPVATWRFAGATAEAARVMSLPGAAYRFSLSLLDGGATDDLPFNAANLTSRFAPADGRPPIAAGGVVTVQLSMTGTR